MQVWVNGAVVDPDEPAIRIDDHGVTVGDGVFETVKVVDGRPFALTRHLDRLGRSARGLGLPDPDPELVRKGVDGVLAAEHLPLGRVRITVTGGPAPLGSGRGPGELTTVVAAAPMQPADPSTAVVTVPWPRNERGALSGLKTTSYGENVVALAHARARGAGEAIFGNLAGNLCEGTGSNVFYVRSGELCTPTLASGCLAGVSRALVLEWYGGREVDAPLTVLHEAEEVFLVSTTRDVQPVHRCDDRELQTGPVTRAVAQAWQVAAERDNDP
ncbi:MAG: aminotransferase class IV [Marmoricola sp.]